MIRRRFLANPNFGTFYAADDGSNATTGSAPAAVETDSAPADPTEPAAPEKAAPEKAAPEPPASSEQPKLGLVARVQAAMADKGTLVAQIGTLKTQVSDLTNQLTEANAEKTRLNSELSRVGTQAKQDAETIAELERSVGSLTTEKKTVSEAATDIVSSLGFAIDKLPASTSASQEENPSEDGLQGLYDAFKKETNPDKKARIHAKINATHQAQSKKN